MASTFSGLGTALSSLIAQRQALTVALLGVGCVMAGMIAVITISELDRAELYDGAPFERGCGRCEELPQ